MPAEEGPSLARTRTVPRSMMSRLRDDSQRTVAESSLEEHGSYLLEEQPAGLALQALQ